MRKISVVRHSVLNIITLVVMELKREYLHCEVRKEPESQLFRFNLNLIHKDEYIYKWLFKAAAFAHI